MRPSLSYVERKFYYKKKIKNNATYHSIVLFLSYKPIEISDSDSRIAAVVFSKIQAVNLNQRFKIAIRNNATSAICMKFFFTK
jgi:hypothetical protein